MTNLYNNIFATNTEDNSRIGDNITNPFFNFNSTEIEQNLLRQMSGESIAKNGIEFVYVRRDLVEVDRIFGESMQNTFTKAYKFVALVDTYDDYEGGGDIFSKYDLEVDDEINITVEPILFKHQVDDELPQMGDLIYMPMGGALFEITWVEDEMPWYTNGIKTHLKINASKFRYNGETVNVSNQGTIDVVDNTPYDEINKLDDKIDTSLPVFAESIQIQTEGDALTSIIDELNPFGIEL